MQNDCYIKLNLPLGDILELIYYEFNNNITKFYTSTYKMRRIDLSKSLKQKIQSILPYNIADCGIFHNAPNFVYNWHTDKQRKCAINMLLVEKNELFVTKFFYNNQFIETDYEKDIPILFNTQVPHFVTNNSRDLNRYILSLGCIDESYEQVKTKLSHVLL